MKGIHPFPLMLTEPMSFFPVEMTRRDSIRLTILSVLGLCGSWQTADAASSSILPVGSSPDALEVDHFPTRAHAFVWRNWQLVPQGELAKVLKVAPKEVAEMGRAMGLEDAGEISDEVRHRSALSVIRRNWHLLPYDQLLELLGWDAEKLAFTLKEDDFLFHKLGLLKPKCDPLLWPDRTEAIRAREKEISSQVKNHFGGKRLAGTDPLFSFVKQLSEGTTTAVPVPKDADEEPLRFCYSYFALYGDPLLETELDPYPYGFTPRRPSKERKLRTIPSNDQRLSVPAGACLGGCTLRATQKENRFSRDTNPYEFPEVVCP
jgi:hypothetical protein